MINAVHCRLIVFVCSNQLREDGRSKEKGGGRWSGGRRVMPRAYYARAPGVGLLGWSKGAGCSGHSGLVWFRACWMVWRTPSMFVVTSLFQKRRTR